MKTNEGAIFKGAMQNTNFNPTTSAIVESSSTGVFSATKLMINGFITDGTAIGLLEDTNNWNNITKAYTGTAITGTYQGQSHYTADYYFLCVVDNTWIRLPRV